MSASFVWAVATLLDGVQIEYAVSADNVKERLRMQRVLPALANAMIMTLTPMIANGKEGRLISRHQTEAVAGPAIHQVSLPLG